MFIVGALLAAAAPLIANGLLGIGLITATQAVQFGAASVAWTGAFFGAFGMIQTAVAPVISKFFETKREAAVLSQIAGLTHASDASPALPAKAPSVAQSISPTHFQDIIAASQGQGSGKAIS